MKSNNRTKDKNKKVSHENPSDKLKLRILYDTITMKEIVDVYTLVFVYS